MRSHCLLTCVAVGLFVSACSKSSNPSQPSSSAGGGTASVTVPRAMSPAASSTIRNVDQPVTLTIANAVLTQDATPTYTFEVSTDSAFGTKTYSKSGVPAGANGQTSLKIDPIGPGATYYWRARAEGGGTAGPYTAPRQFTIGPAVTLGAPQLNLPPQGSAQGSLPLFSVTNGGRSGPVGAIRYRFEASTSQAFDTHTLDVTVAEGVSRTAYQTTSEIAPEATIYWRVTAIDETNGISATSAPASFNTSLAIDLHRAVFLNSPDISNWPRTATLTLVEQDGGGSGPVCMQYTDPGWPDTDWPFDNTTDFGVYANQWYFAKINGVWYGGAGEWIYRGASSCKAGQGTKTIGPDSGFGEPFRSWVPKVGEPVGFMVSSVARNGPVKRTVDQRSNIIVQPWRDTSLGSASIPFVRSKP